MPARIAKAARRSATSSCASRCRPASAPTSPAEHVARDILRWAAPHDDRTFPEREADDTKELTAHLDAVRVALGDRPCERTSPDDARILRWARQRKGTAALVARCHGSAG